MCTPNAGVMFLKNLKKKEILMPPQLNFILFHFYNLDLALPHTDDVILETFNLPFANEMFKAINTMLWPLTTALWL